MNAEVNYNNELKSNIPCIIQIRVQWTYNNTHNKYGNTHENTEIHMVQTEITYNPKIQQINRVHIS